MKKISMEEYTIFAMNYASGQQTQRLGQSFVNRFCKDLEPKDTEDLFYTENREEAVQIIFDRFVDL